MGDKLEKSPTGYYEANQGFATVHDGEQLFVQLGELVKAGHPLLKGREDLFKPALRISRFDVEQATSAPGEKRGDSAPKRRRGRPPKAKAAPAHTLVPTPPTGTVPTNLDPNTFGLTSSHLP